MFFLQKDIVFSLFTEFSPDPGSAKCIWHVQEFELFGYATNKKKWVSYDLLVFWSHDTEWDVLACSSGKFNVFYKIACMCASVSAPGYIFPLPLYKTEDLVTTFSFIS